MSDNAAGGRGIFGRQVVQFTVGFVLVCGAVTAVTVVPAVQLPNQLLGPLAGMVVIGLLGVALSWRTDRAVETVSENAVGGEADGTLGLGQLAEVVSDAAEERDELEAHVSELEAERDDLERRFEKLDTQYERQNEQIEAFKRAMQQCAAGQLTTRMEESEAAEFNLAGDFNEMMDELEDTVRHLKEFIILDLRARLQVSEGTEEVEEASEQITDTIQQISVGASKQSDQLQSVNQEMEQLSSNIQEIASLTNEVATSSKKTAKTGQQGRDAAQAAIEGMNEIEAGAEEATEAIETLREEMHAIDELVEFIGDVAQQTNMLALNANIEASRSSGAEEADGEGFGVVAQEVKELADESQEAANTIEERIDTIQEETETATRKVQDVGSKVSEHAASIELALEALEEIATFAEQTHAGVQNIDTAAEEQAKSTQQVVSLVDETASISNKTTDLTEDAAAATEEQTATLTEVSRSADELSTKAARLKDTLDMFKVTQSPDDEFSPGSDVLDDVGDDTPTEASDESAGMVDDGAGGGDDDDALSSAVDDELSATSTASGASGSADVSGSRTDDRSTVETAEPQASADDPGATSSSSFQFDETTESVSGEHGDGAEATAATDGERAVAAANGGLDVEMETDASGRDASTGGSLEVETDPEAGATAAESANGELDVAMEAGTSQDAVEAPFGSDTSTGEGPFGTDTPAAEAEQGLDTHFGTGIAAGEDSYAIGRDAAGTAHDALGIDRVDFCQVFCSSAYDYEAVIEGIRSVIGDDAELIGCSSSGEFTESQQAEGSVTVALVTSDTLRFFTGIGTGLSKGVPAAVDEAVESLPASVEGYPHLSAINLHDGLSGVSDQIALVTERKLGRDITLAGGAAGDDFKLEETHVFADGEVATDAVAIGLIASKEPISVSMDHGHSPISDPLTVTKADGGTVLELDGKPAFEAWTEAVQSYLREIGEGPIDFDSIEGGSLELLGVLTEFEFGIKEAGEDEYKIRWPGLDLTKGGSLTFPVAVPEGTELHVMHSPPNDQIDAAWRTANEASAGATADEIAGAFIYECACRSIILGDDFDQAVAAVSKELPTDFIGIETYGELCMEEGQLSGFHNTSTVVMLLPK